jgi:hypothetical protein
MRFDTSRIDERIHRLQEVKRIVSDPELVQMLLEFLEVEEKVERPRRMSPAPEAGRGLMQSDDASDLVNRITRTIGA